MLLSDKSNKFQTYVETNLSIQDGKNLIIMLWIRLVYFL